MLIQKSFSKPSRVHQIPRRITTSAGPGMKILLIHPLAESSHQSVSGTTSPATANAQYHRGVMLRRKVHNGFCAGGMRRGFAVDGAAFATLMSIWQRVLNASPERRRKRGTARRQQRRRSYARGPLRDSLCRYLERAPGET